ncbi:hypothetical protein [Aquimarina longa]|uniref:hypothetical protein n=1 Tax=Aquimarina longa TaxID=1080221 RepID=UPI0007854FC2|nr:hypothetical protein [Aquimarina longa]
MKNLKYILEGWNDAYGELQNDEDTLDFYRTTYEDEIDKTILEEALSSLESWSKYAYKNKLLFHVTAIMENDQPYADILFNDGNILIHFIDEYNRFYMTYTFSKQEGTDQVFMSSLHYFIYPDSIKEFTNDDIRDVQYIFTPEGKLTIWDRYLEKGKWYEEAKEAEEPVNVASNWEPYPQLGDYQSIIRLERWEDNELAQPWVEKYIKKYIYKDGSRFYKDEDGNLIEDN